MRISLENLKTNGSKPRVVFEQDRVGYRAETWLSINDVITKMVNNNWTISEGRPDAH